MRGFQSEIERGLGESILDVLLDSLDDQLGPAFEQAFRDHLRAQARDGRLGRGVVAVGRWWRDNPPVEIDAVVLSGRSRTPTLVGEAKWARAVDARRPLAALREKARWLDGASPDLTYAICARERIEHAAAGVMAVTAADIFPG